MQTTEPATSTAPAAAAAEQPGNSADAVSAVVSTDWAKYDTDKDGNLSKAEFSVWMTALLEQNPAQKATVSDPAAWANSAFAMADKDKSGSVNKDELAGFLKG
jgi:Ca2+-binding EF-hand superfamily protein